MLNFSKTKSLCFHSKFSSYKIKSIKFLFLAFLILIFTSLKNVKSYKIFNIDIPQTVTSGENFNVSVTATTDKECTVDNLKLVGILPNYLKLIKKYVSPKNNFNIVLKKIENDMFQFTITSKNNKNFSLKKDIKNEIISFCLKVKKIKEEKPIQFATDITYSMKDKEEYTENIKKEIITVQKKTECDDIKIFVADGSNKNIELSPKFDRNNKNYIVKVGSDVKRIEIRVFIGTESKIINKNLKKSGSETLINIGNNYNFSILREKKTKKKSSEKIKKSKKTKENKEILENKDEELKCFEEFDDIDESNKDNINPETGVCSSKIMKTCIFTFILISTILIFLLRKKIKIKLSNKKNFPLKE
ncbi:MAG: hypothetical protein FWC41_03700 [Firmicutes bacterium]|nr:hypothetical protein [Bacillota bacterium]